MDKLIELVDKVDLENPSPERFAVIFSRYAASCGLEVPQGLLEWLLARYEAERRPLRSCEPRDLVERARHICKYRGWREALTQDILSLAWKGYLRQRTLICTHRHNCPFVRPKACTLVWSLTSRSTRSTTGRGSAPRCS